jgi:CBS-domain-containing membrane protein
MKRFWHRHQASICGPCTLKAGLGALVGIGLIAALGEWTHLPLLIAPFGATCALLFLVPESPMAQPANVIGGHMITATIALIADAILPGTWWGISLAVGVSIIAMGMVRLVHPPAGANPIIVMFSHPGVQFIFMPILLGAVSLVGLALLVHRLPPKPVPYPLPLPDKSSKS